MSAPTFGSIFSGGGLADVGAEMAGLTPLWAIEHDADIAGCYTRNLPGRMIVADVRDVDPRDLDTPTVFWLSPPCQDASQARSKKLPPRNDARIGLDALRYVRALLPPAVALENVPQYEQKDTFKGLVRGLWDLGYTVRWDVIDSGDYRVPQTRRRLYVRAVRGGLVAQLPARMRPKVGWYAATEDLLPSCPDSAFAPWQLRRLEAAGVSFLLDGARSSAGGLSGSERGATRSDASEPAFTVTASATKRPLRAFLAHPTADNPRFPTADADEPAFTVTGTHGTPRAFLQMTGNTITSGSGSARAWLDGGRVVKLTPRALSRLMGLPDTYELPASAALAGRVIGNGVCPPIAALVCRNLLHAVAATAE